MLRLYSSGPQYFKENLKNYYLFRQNLNFHIYLFRQSKENYLYYEREQLRDPS